MGEVFGYAEVFEFGGYGVFGDAAHGYEGELGFFGEGFQCGGDFGDGLGFFCAYGIVSSQVYVEELADIAFDDVVDWLVLFESSGNFQRIFCFGRFLSDGLEGDACCSYVSFS